MRKRNPPFSTSRGEWFVVSAYPKRKKQGEMRVAIPRTLFPLSTSRNRLKRQVREAVRILKRDESQNLLVILQKGGRPSFGTIQKEIGAHLKKIGILQR